MILDVIIEIVLGHQELRPYKRATLIDKCSVCSDCPTDWLTPVSLPLLRPPYSLRHTMLKLGQLITLQWPISVQVKGRVAHLSL